MGLGVGQKIDLRSGLGPRYFYPFDKYPDRGMLDDEFVNDPRVAMAMMELARKKGFTIMVGPKGVEQIEHPTWSGYSWVYNESLPLAINLACVEALSE